MHDDGKGLRKAAIVLAALDPPVAERVLATLKPPQAESLRRALTALGDVDEQEQQRVIEEFLRIGPMIPEKQPPGIELDGRWAKRLSLHPRRPAAEPGAGARSPGVPFRSLQEAETDKLARVLATERPQTIALVLAHLSAQQAGAVLARFVTPLQVEVIRRLVELEETDPEILWEVEEALCARLADQVPMQRRRVAGVSALAAILEASSSDVQLQILDNLSAHEPELAERLGPACLGFEALESFDDASLGTVFDGADPALTALALLGAPPRLVDRVLQQFPEHTARDVQEQLAHVGPTRLSDVEEARRQIMQHVRRLAMRRRIRLPNQAACARPARADSPLAAASAIAPTH